MSMEENAKQLLSILAPVSLVVAPVGFLGGLYVLFTDQNAARVSLFDKFFWFGLCVVGFVIAIWYCRAYMGWFRKKE